VGAATAFPDLQIAGIADDPEHVLPGDMFCCVERITRSSVWDGHEPEAVHAALAAGAVAILAEKGTEFPDGLVPDTVPIIFADEVDELAARLAAVLFGESSSATVAG
jgi:UDP-N-acetylmuramyl tripeptide synthase